MIGAGRGAIRPRIAVCDVKLLVWILGLPIAIVTVVFALSNRDRAPFKLWPFPFEVEAPLFVFVFTGVLLGFAAGAITAWNAGRKWRRLARVRRQESTRLGRELAAARERTPEPIAADTGPAPRGRQLAPRVEPEAGPR